MKNRLYRENANSRQKDLPKIQENIRLMLTRLIVDKHVGSPTLKMRCSRFTSKLNKLSPFLRKYNYGC